MNPGTNKLMKTMNSEVRINSSNVEKFTNNPIEMARKYRAIFEISENFEFIAPNVQAIKSDRIVMDKVENISSIRNYYLNRNLIEMEEILFNCGKILYRIHENLSTKYSNKWVPTDFFNKMICQYLSIDQATLNHIPITALHNDFSFANLFVVDGRTDQICVIDPCPNFGSTFAMWTCGPSYLDLGKLMSCLEGQISIQYQYRRPTARQIVKMQRAVLEGYEMHGPAVDRKWLHAFAYATAAVQLERGRHPLIAYLRRRALYNGAVGNFPWKKKLFYIDGV
jgi:hypothetical protein